MLSLIAKRPACEAPVAGPAKNNPPQVTIADAFTIPALTPFTLTAQATDPDEEDKERLTYSWEEIDLGSAGPPSDDDASQPLFRNYGAVKSPTRLFPSLEYILNNQNAPPLTVKRDDSEYLTGETLPSTERKMKFRVSVRDNRPSTDVVGGAIAMADTLVSVVAKAGPFKVTAPVKEATWNTANTQTVTWDVAGTSADPINCQKITSGFRLMAGKPSRTCLVIPYQTRARRRSTYRPIFQPPPKHVSASKPSEISSLITPTLISTSRTDSLNVAPEPILDR